MSEAVLESEDVVDEIDLEGDDEEELTLEIEEGDDAAEAFVTRVRSDLRQMGESPRHDEDDLVVAAVKYREEAEALAWHFDDLVDDLEDQILDAFEEGLVLEARRDPIEESEGIQRLLDRGRQLVADVQEWLDRDRDDEDDLVDDLEDSARISREVA